MVPTSELEGYGRRRWILRVVGLAVTAGIVIALVLIPARSKPVPDFELPLLTGRGTLLSDQLKGSPVVLNFWKSSCLPCQREAPLLERTYRAYRDQGVRFVGVDIEDTKANARRFVRQFGITYPIVTDYDKALARQLDIYGLPQTFFIDKSWELSSKNAGQRLGNQGGTVVLGSISKVELTRRIEDLID
jgi:cytochrome c biogenesis protein CcmG/thiol:disulfide interchange protein DsbE